MGTDSNLTCTVEFATDSHQQRAFWSQIVHKEIIKADGQGAIETEESPQGLSGDFGIAEDIEAFKKHQRIIAALWDPVFAYESDAGFFHSIISIRRLRCCKMDGRKLPAYLSWSPCSSNCKRCSMVKLRNSISRRSRPKTCLRTLASTSLARSRTKGIVSCVIKTEPSAAFRTSLSSEMN